jgi:hypothetical protein
MRRSAGAEVKDLLPDLIAYTQQVMNGLDSSVAPHPAVFNSFPRPGKKGPSADSLINPKAAPAPLDGTWVKSSIASSIFVVWKQVQDYVSSVDNWEMVPGNVDGIYQKTILPELRRVKDPRVLEYWDMRMQRDEDNASKSGRNFDLTKFYDTDKPQLMWNRAQELLVLNMKNRAINDMMVVIKTYPTHPNVPDWISQVEALVQPPAASPAPAPAAQASVAPQTAPQPGRVPQN